MEAVPIPKEVEELQDKLIFLLSSLVNTAKRRLQFREAAFYAEKLYHVKSDLTTLLQWAECLFLLKDYKNVTIILRQSPHFLQSLRCQYLAALSCYESGKLDEANEVLEHSKALLEDQTFTTSIPTTYSRDECSWKCAVYLLKGKIAESSRSTLAAVKAYKKALNLDPNCYEAFYGLTRHQLMPPKEEMEFLNSLGDKDFASEVSKVFYDVQHPFNCSNRKLQESISSLYSSTADFRLREAIAAFEKRDCETALRICRQIRMFAPYHEQCLRILIACLYELGLATELFSLAHELIKADRRWALSYYTVGCYYMTSGACEPARRFIRKAISLDQMNGDYWVALGHAFAHDAEHDQAISCYFTASKFIRGSHYPMMYVGLEYSRTNNSRLAEKFYLEALQCKSNDPSLLHELGVAQYYLGKYDEALRTFETAKMLVGEPAVQWEPLYRNLGQTYRNLKRYKEALEYFDLSLSLKPMNASSILSKALVLIKMENYPEAFDLLHQATWWRRDQLIVNHSLSKLLNVMMEVVEVTPAPDQKEFTDCMELFKLRPWPLFDRDKDLTEEDPVSREIVEKLLSSDQENEEKWMQDDTR